MSLLLQSPTNISPAKRNISLTVPILATVVAKYAGYGRGNMPHNMEKTRKSQAWVDLLHFINNNQPILGSGIIMKESYLKDLVAIIITTANALPPLDNPNLMRNQSDFIATNFAISSAHVNNAKVFDIMTTLNGLYAIQKTMTSGHNNSLSLMTHDELQEFTKAANKEAVLTKTDKGNMLLKRTSKGSKLGVQDDYEDSDIEEVALEGHGNEDGTFQRHGDESHHEKRQKTEPKKVQRRGPNDRLTATAAIPLNSSVPVQPVRTQDLMGNISDIGTVLEKLLQTSAPPSTAVPAVDPGNPETLVRKLATLQALLDDGHIDQCEYDGMRAKHLANF